MFEGKQLEKSIPIPLYYQLKQIILDEIDSGNCPVDTMLPTENELIDIFDVSRTTVRQAIIELVREGKLYRVKSKGTFVARQKLGHALPSPFRTFDDEVRERGKIPSIDVLALEIIPMPEDLAVLREESGKKAIYLERLRKADDEPIAYTETYMPYEGYEFLLDEDFTKRALYSLLSEHENRMVVRMTRQIEAVAANAKDCKMLKVKRGAPIHYFETTGYDRDGKVVQRAFSRYRGDSSRFRIEMMVEEVFKK